MRIIKGSLAAEGMWMPHQAAEIGEAMRADGLQLDPAGLGRASMPHRPSLAALSSRTARSAFPILLLAMNWTSPAEASEKPAADGAGSKDQSLESDQIVVVGEVPAVQSSPGMIEYNVAENLQSEAGSAADVLNTLPSVSVSSDGVVSVRGRTDVEILVDGRPSAAMNRDSRGTTLQTLPGSDLASVEVITNPSVGVESAGATVINLKLRKDDSLGPRATLSGNVDHRARQRLALDTSYSLEDLTLDFDASYRRDVRIDGYVITRRFLDPEPGGAAWTTIVGDYTPTRSHAGNVQAKLRLNASDHTELGGSVNYTRYVASNLVDFVDTDFDAAGRPLDRTSRFRDSRLGKHDGDINLYLTRKDIFGDGKLEIAGQYGTGSGRSDRTFRITRNGDSAASRLLYAGNHTDYSFYRTTADFDVTVDENLTLETGLKHEISYGQFRTGVAEIDLHAPFPTKFVGEPDDFRVEREDLSAHAEATLRLTGWTVKGGLKWRDTRFDLKNGNAARFLRRRFDTPDVSLSLERNLPSGNIAVSVSRLHQLPSAEDLNPTVVVVDDLNQTVGNPQLIPQKAVRAEIRYDTTLAGLKTAATIYYRATQNPIVFVYDAVDANVVRRSRINSDLEQDYGLELSANGKLTDDLKVDLSGNLYRTETSATVFGVSRRDALITYSAKVALDWSVSDADKLRIDLRADGPSLLVQGRETGDIAVSAVWQHKMNDDLSLTISALQFLQTPHIVTEYIAPTVAVRSRRDIDETALQVGMTLKLR